MKKWIAFLQSRIHSFQNAITGIKDILTTEHNALIHLVCTVFVLGVSFWLDLSAVEFVLIIIVIAMVWISETFNTVLEIVIDIVSPKYSEFARRAKDIAAAGVLFAAIIAFVTGILILVPHLMEKIS